MKSMQELVEVYGPPISVYTRKQAIADGCLVAVGDPAKEAGFRIPVALTRDLWNDCVAWTDADNKRHGTVQDESGRLWDVLWLAYLRVRAQPAESDETVLFFTVHRVPVEGRGHMPRRQQIKIELHGDDEGQPCITLMLPHED